MGKFLTLAVVLATAITFGAATGTATPADPDGTASVDVTCQWIGDVAKIVILGTPGQSCTAYDANGLPLAAEVIQTGKVRFMIGTSGVGPNGSTIFVVVDDEIVASTDPFWEWD